MGIAAIYTVLYTGLTRQMNPRAQRLKKLKRGDLGDPKVTQKELAEHLGVDKLYITLMESGRAKISDEDMARLEAAIQAIRARKLASSTVPAHQAE